jgi:hypothetical protein
MEVLPLRSRAQAISRLRPCERIDLLQAYLPLPVGLLRPTIRPNRWSMTVIENLNFFWRNDKDDER